MVSTTNSLDIKLQGRTYTVRCATAEQPALVAAATYLDEQMSRIARQFQPRDNGKPLSMENLAVMTALNLAHDQLVAKENTQTAGPIPPQPQTQPSSAAELPDQTQVEHSTQKLSQSLPIPPSPTLEEQPTATTTTPAQPATVPPLAAGETLRRIRHIAARLDAALDTEPNLF